MQLDKKVSEYPLLEASGLDKNNAFVFVALPVEGTSKRMSVTELQTAVQALTNAMVDSDLLQVIDGILTIKAIPAEKLSTKAKAIQLGFISSGKNLFNIGSADNQLGHYINYTNGISYVNAAYNCTEYIPVKAETVYTFALVHWLAWYDADKNFISGFDNSATNTQLTATSPVGAAYVRFDCFAVNWALNQLEEGSESTDYESFHYEINMDGAYPVMAKRGSRDLFNQIIGTRELAIPAIIHILKNSECNIYYDSIISLKAGQNSIAQIVAEGGKTYERFFRITPSATGNISATVKLYDMEFNVMAERPLILTVTDDAITTPVKLLSLGDSYTYGGYIQYTIANKVGTGITFLGTRLSATGSIPIEGRGGWTLGMYMTELIHSYGFSPFLQPQTENKYFGNTAFWKNVHDNPTAYECNGFGAIRTSIGFDDATGLLSAPNVGDVMYDNSSAKFVAWSGSAWTEIQQSTLNFSFNFEKYLSVWELDTPNAISIMLGINDLFSSSQAEFDTKWSEYKTYLDTAIASIHDLDSSIKIAICIPPAGATQDGFIDTTQLSASYKVTMWRFYKKLVEEYDGRQSSNIYIVDTASALDRVYGISYTDDQLPFALYTGTERVKYQNNNVHPTPDGYAQIGERLAGWIQAIR